MAAPVLLALGSALSYGFVDFAGGMLARRAVFTAVAFACQAGGFVFMIGVVLILPSASPSMADLWWGAASGVGTGVGMVFLYRGMVRGAMSVVVPVSAVGSVTLPVLAGVLLFGERPSAVAWGGIAVAISALWAVSRSGPGEGTGPTPHTRDALIASCGFAVQYLALAQAAPEAGLWPVVASRFAATLTVLPMALTTGNGVRLSPRHTVYAVLIGSLAALSLLLYMLATQRGLTAIAVVLSSFYPVVPVVLGIVALRERPSRTQAAGLAGAAAAVVLLAFG
ncbi:EamA family transporter [Amycolatopsis sp. NPDC051071]|uniref:EamA family transporter n=1 Tax=Amycolatopsis sp. NPDC051071 TaxID=3154637 RepID=UPI0034145F99